MTHCTMSERFYHRATSCSDLPCEQDFQIGGGGGGGGLAGDEMMYALCLFVYLFIYLLTYLFT